MNLHARYIIGILAFLLIGAVAIQWDRVPDLPGVVSFALGLASLLLAIIAIIQTLTGNKNVDASLGSLRTASAEIAGSAAQLNEMAGKMVDSSEAGNKRLQEIKEALLANDQQNSDQSDGGAVEQSPVVNFDIYNEDIPLGGALAIYMAALSAKTGKGFNPIKVLPDDKFIGFYVNGWLASLRGYKILPGSVNSSVFKFELGDNDFDALVGRINSSRFDKPEKFEEYKKRIDEFFQN